MKTGPLLLLLVFLLLVGAAYYLRPILFERTQQDTSDAKGATETIKLGGDDYCGYWFLTSPDMRMLLPRNGLTIDFTNDGGAYEERMKKFKNKEYDAIVLPVNSYLQHGAKYKFPGVIVAVLAESRGADAIVGFGDVLPSGKLNELNNHDLKIVYTGESPSSFLLDLIISDFGLDQLRDNKDWRKEVASSEEAYKLAKKAQKDRTLGDAFVVWEPHVSKAVDELGMNSIWDSGKFAGYIIDVLVFHRNYIKKNPDRTKKFMKTYFRVLNRYAADKERLVKEMRKSLNLKQSVVENMIKKVKWFSLRENCHQFFGIKLSSGKPTNDKIISAITQCAIVLERSGNFNNSDLRDPYLIVNSEFLEQVGKADVKNIGSGKAVKKKFARLSNDEWQKIQEIGTMRIEPISFQQGTNNLDDYGRELVDKVAVLLTNNYPAYRVAVRGHTGPGDPKANKELSIARAEVITERLIGIHKIDPLRLHAEGLGATQPPKQKTGESTRAFRLRMPRVEFVLLDGENL